MTPSIYIDLTLTHASITQPILTGNYSNSYRKEETKKEKIARIAKEKMYASWKIVNQKQINLNELIRIAKPKYNLMLIPKRR